MKNNRISKKFNRKTKLIMLVSAIAIALLTVGYATFTTTLNIGNTTASIPAGTNNLSNEVVFGSSSITTSGAADAGSVVGTASGQTWNSSTAVFTSSIRSIVFTAPVYNNSAYDVYLTSMQSVSGAKLSCTNGTGDNAASSDLFDNFCNNTKATYSFGGTTVECDVNKCKTTLNSYELVSGGGTSNVTLTVSTLSTSTPLPDGQISISIPGITIGFSTTVDTNLSATNYVSNLTTDDSTISAVLTMAAGVQSFGLSTDSSTEPTSWLTEDDNGTLTGTTWNLEYTYNHSGTYYLWIKDINGLITKIGMFTVEAESAASYLIKNITSLVTDVHGTNNEYTNYRYVGANPDNYACFDDGSGGCVNYSKDNATSKPAGLFRIIGVFNEDTHGVAGKQLVKVISADTLGNSPISWDYKKSGIGSSSSKEGSNDWSDAQLMYMLNGLITAGYNGNTLLHTGYTYDSTSYTLKDTNKNKIYTFATYNDSIASYLTGNGTTTLNIPVYSTGSDATLQTLKTTQANMIASVTWHLGGTASYDSNSNGLASHWYNYERGTTIYSGNPTIWIGKIGLMYPSDYGYATSASSTCFSKAVYNYNSTDTCKSNNWLFYSGSRTGSKGSATKQWTMSTHSATDYNVFYVDNYGGLYMYYPHGYDDFYVRPSFYLESTVTIAGGTGTSTDPYRFAM